MGVKVFHDVEKKYGQRVFTDFRNTHSLKEFLNRTDQNMDPLNTMKMASQEELSATSNDPLPLAER